MKLTLRQRLEEVRRLIGEETHWCKEEMCLDTQGDWVSFSSKDAHAYCLHGAIRRACYTPCYKGNYDHNVEERDALLNLLADALRNKGGQCDFDVDGIIVTEFNDHPNTSHSDVIELLDEVLSDDYLWSELDGIFEEIDAIMNSKEDF